MKKLIRLIFVALAAWVAYKYLNDSDIKVDQLFDRVADRVAEFTSPLDEGSGSVEENHILQPSSPGVTGTSKGAGNNYSSGVPDLNVKIENRGSARQPEKELQSSHAPEYEIVEYAIPEKVIPGTGAFAGLDRYAAGTPPEAETSMETLADWLSQKASGELEKARLIFTWVATHVWYDDKGFNTGDYAGTSPEAVFTNRLSVCQGYSELFTALCNIAGLEAFTVTGYAKGIGYRPGSVFHDSNHAWNVAKIDGEWKLFDVTWASGFGRGVNGRLVTVHEFNDYWFDVNPNEAIFSHFPEEDEWQMNNPKISKYQFERLPNLSSTYFKLGFSGEYCLAGVLDGSLQELPESYSISGDLKVVSMPYPGRIASGQTIRLRVRAGEGVTPAYCNGGNITDMTRDGDEYTTVITTVPGRFRLMMTRGGGSYETALIYNVR
ncbi:MAG TPA: transglutaminase domain-containing protein [Bacteroidales bacterium]|nr:transglutaminase domain-containing protein [Bacteroidales bacterium]HPJ58791.1 transglutaminase domain-containing protein [Bacteroidales bacterium]HPR11941.1 transglutaminase domain-containing protein [Bacteroidales bacterium]HRW85767.1 transglutaminase domain-containing protein [Bacteroidales bacterium]